jgi:precorrin-6B methylase 2
VSVLDRLHQWHVSGRRVRVLSQHLAKLLPEGATVLDVGAGDGSLARAVMERRPDVDVRGIEVLLRPTPHIPI